MNNIPLWSQFEELAPSGDAVTSSAIAAEATASHLLIKGQSGEPAFLLLCEGRKAPRAPISLRHVAVFFDIPFEVKLEGTSTEVVARYTRLSCSPQSPALHRWFVELIAAVTQRFPGALSSDEVDEVLASMLELFRQTSTPSVSVITGLWGELLVIYSARNPEAFVRAWHLSPSEVFDFAFPDLRLEVKTTERAAREHEVALAQVRGGRTSDCLVSIEVARSSAGSSVLELVNGIARRVDDTIAERLWRVVMGTLGTEVEGVDELRFDIGGARASLRVFQASEIPAPVVPPEFDAFVSNVRFKVCLGLLGAGEPPDAILERA